MDFFKSVFSDDPDPPAAKQESDSPRNDGRQENPDRGPQETNPSPTDTGTGAWSFGGLFKTISTKSESVLETYRRDLKEFGSELKKEIEVAQGSLENVSHKIDEIGSTVWKETTQIISQGKDTILSGDQESDSSDYSSSDRNFSSDKKYSRLDAQVRAIQGDVSTYCDEPEDLDDYDKWKLGFDSKGKIDNMENLFEENGAMESIYKRVVPSIVDHETFWCRYYYRVYRLKQVDHLRAIMVKRATEEADLSWDVDDEEFEESNGLSKANLKAKEQVDGKDSDKLVKEEALQGVSSGDANKMQEKVKPEKEINVVPEVETLSNRELNIRDSDQIVKEVSVQESDKKGDKISKVDKEGKGSVDGSNNDELDDEKVNLDKGDDEGAVSKSDEKVALEGKGDNGESGKDSDFSLASAHEEEDLGWDEIEDLSSIEEKDDKKVSHGGGANKADLRKRLSTAEDDEDLSWDVEEDDEPVKA